MTDFDLSAADARAIRDGNEASSALAVVAPHFAALKDAAMERWRTSSSGQTDLREKLWTTVNTIACVEKALADLVGAAVFAQQAADQDFSEAVAARNALAGQGLTRP